MASSNFQIDNGVVKDDLNCANCKSVPNDACLVPCGCRLCQICINDLMASGLMFCPGPSEECGGSLLLQSVTDYRANKNISKMPINCPNNGCVHACQLANMEEHLRVCPRKNVECPFRGLSCNLDKLACDEMNSHLHRGSLSHTEILIGMINNINNEMEGSKRQIEMLNTMDEDRKRQIENLNQADVINKESVLGLRKISMCHKNKVDVLEKTIECNKREIAILKNADEDKQTEIKVLKERNKNDTGDIDMRRSYMWNMKKIEVLEKRDESNKKDIDFLKNNFMCLKTQINVLEDADKDNKRAIKVLNEKESYKKEIELLKCELEQRNVQIKSIMDEIESMKQENKGCTNQMKFRLAETKREIDHARNSSNAKVIEYVDEDVNAINKDIQSINQRIQSIKADIYSMKSQIKVPSIDSIRETVSSMLGSTLDNGTSRGTHSNIRKVAAKADVTPRGRGSNHSRSRSTASYYSSDQDRSDVNDNDSNTTDWTRLQRYPRTLGRPSQRRSYRRRSSRYQMEAESTNVRCLAPDNRNEVADPLFYHPLAL